MDYISKYVDLNIGLHIVGFIQTKDILFLSATCKQLYYICNLPQIWKQNFQNWYTNEMALWFEDKISYLTYNLDWKALFKRSFGRIRALANEIKAQCILKRLKTTIKDPDFIQLRVLVSDPISQDQEVYYVQDLDNSSYDEDEGTMSIAFRALGKNECFYYRMFRYRLGFFHSATLVNITNRKRIEERTRTLFTTCCAYSKNFVQSREGLYLKVTVLSNRQMDKLCEKLKVNPQVYAARGTTSDAHNHVRYETLSESLDNYAVENTNQYGNTGVNEIEKVTLLTDIKKLYAEMWYDEDDIPTNFVES